MLYSDQLITVEEKPSVQIKVERNNNLEHCNSANQKMGSSCIPLRHVLGLILFFSFILTTIITKQQMSWNQETSFRRVIAERTINVSRRVKIRSQISFKNGTYPNLKHARTGPAINCLQKPLTDPSNFDSKEMIEKNERKYAYAWYVARPAYLCSAIAALKHLKEIRAKAQNGNLTSLAKFSLCFLGQSFIERRIWFLWKTSW